MLGRCAKLEPSPRLECMCSRQLKQGAMVTAAAQAERDRVAALAARKWWRRS